jgi:hypothetical protein
MAGLDQSTAFLEQRNSNSKHESPKDRKPEKRRMMGRPFEQISAEIIGAALAVHKS